MNCFQACGTSAYGVRVPVMQDGGGTSWGCINSFPVSNHLEVNVQDQAVSFNISKLNFCLILQSKGLVLSPGWCDCHIIPEKQNKTDYLFIISQWQILILKRILPWSTQSVLLTCKTGHWGIQPVNEFAVRTCCVG